jgi:phospholipase C
MTTHHRTYAKLTASLIAVTFALSGCASNAQLPSSEIPFAPHGPFSIPTAVNGIGKIKHVVIIIQENRTLDNMFYGYPGADTVKSGKTSTGATIMLRPASLSIPIEYVMDHSASSMYLACDGKGPLPGMNCRNDGFDRDLELYCSSNQCPKPPINYVYVPHSDSKPYFDMAHEWVLADHNFQSHLDESFVGHQYLIAAQADSSVNLPTYGEGWGCGTGSESAGKPATTVVPDFVPTPKPIPPSKGGLDLVERLNTNRTFGPWQSPCFDYKTLADELDKAGDTWRFYAGSYQSASGSAGEWSAFQAIRHIYYSKEWKTNVISPQTKFFTDIADGKLANVTWITPICVNSDHANCGGGYGPSWVSALVNAVGKSKFWDSTVVFVVWDDWGGLYDHVPPPYKDFDGLGFRVPLLMISPYAKKDFVSHTQYESAGILTFTEDVFGLGRLAAADARATSPAPYCFDFTQKPRRFIAIKAPKDTGFFMQQRNNMQIPDYE